ncbi:hypothetical protein [Saccharothrix australiensis]|uniref:Uncharacterized protein n=1 Tax=Saccharothrix australiensis TaxID=2072 RepID=A0A495VT53_9PSEU|nr:hypothetical protein [Saccharothrix australiensis]RKT51595.1 hypothetical protein C8E97_0074 [Saccharothrix australiensis]
MSEEDLRKGLRAVVADEPPLRFDADALIQRARLARKRRRALVAVGVVTAVLTATVLSLPNALAPHRGHDVDALGQVLTTTSAAPSAAPVVTPPPVTTLERAKYLGAYLMDRFPQVVPGAMKVEADFTDSLKGQPGHVTGFVHFVDEQGSSGVWVQLSGPPLLITRDNFCAGVRCDAPRRQPDGTYLEFATSSSPDHDLVTFSVAHFRANGVVVQVSGYNYDPIGGGQVRDSLPVTAEQLATLATDPNLAAS